MELGIVINELNENVPVMDAYSYNVSFAVDRNFGDRRYSESGLGPGPDTDQRVVSREEKSGVGMKRRYDARFVRPIPPLFIEPVLTSPADYIHLGSLPKRAKLDKYYVRSTVPGVVYDSLLQRPHNVAVSDPLNALGRGDNSIVLMKSNLYGPDVRENASSEKGSYSPHYPTKTGLQNEHHAHQQQQQRSKGELLRLFTVSPPVRTRSAKLPTDDHSLAASTSHSVLTPRSPDIPTPRDEQSLRPPSVEERTITIVRSGTPPQSPPPPPPLPPQPPPPPLPTDAHALQVPKTAEPPTAPPPLPSDLATRPRVEIGKGAESDRLLSEIRQGIALRPVSDAPQGVRAYGGERKTSGGGGGGGGGAELTRDDLLNSIRQGVSLRPVSERQSPARVAAERDEVNAMSRALINRRAAIDPMDILWSRLKIMERARVDLEDEDTDDDDTTFSDTDSF